MERRGRKPKPDAVKAKQGTLRPSRVNHNAPTSVHVEIIPPPPAWLSEIGQAEWREKTEVLQKMQILERADFTLLAAYCNEWSIYVEAETEMRAVKSGRFYVVKEGRKIKYAAALPWVKIAKDALEQVQKIGSEFGFTPASRTKISIPKKDEVKSKAGSLLKAV